MGANLKQVKRTKPGLKIMQDANNKLIEELSKQLDGKKTKKK